LALQNRGGDLRFAVSPRAHKTAAGFFTMNTLTPDQLTLETFAPWVKTKFRTFAETDNFLELELIEAGEIANAGQRQLPIDGPRQEMFSLIFAGPVERQLPQQIYGFEHDQVGRFDLFIVPVGQKAGFILYQAIFNRRIKPG
jgi:hypothetical protein